MFDLQIVAVMATFRLEKDGFALKSASLDQNMDLLTTSFSYAASGHENYVILDAPDHSNVGDSAIFLGELALLRKIFEREPAFVCSQRTYSQDVGVNPQEGVVFLHGGGNFGDVWPVHQDLRENALKSFPNHKIVQLPQSIHFKSEQGLDRCARAIERHSDFMLFVRDKESFAIAQSKFNCEVKMCPDAALALGRLDRLDQPYQPILCLMRSDREGGMGQPELENILALGPVEDWVLDARGMRSLQDRLLEKSARKMSFSRSLLRFRLSQIYENWANERLRRGMMQLSSAEFVVTDRLHAHILCSMMGIPHAVFDNSYGKISRYIDAWQNDEFGTIVNSIEGLHEVLDSF